MKIGVSSYAFRWSVGTDDFRPNQPLSMMALLSKCAEAGAQTVQICENYPLSTAGHKELEAIAVHADSLGLTLEIGMRGANPGNLCRHLEIAQVLQARVIRIVLSGSGWDPDLPAQIEVLKQTLSRLTDDGTVLAIENHFHFHPRQLVQLLESTGDSRLGICLDPLNSISKLAGPQETVDLLADYAVTMHAKDARAVRRNTAFCVVGCPLGEGQVDIQNIIARVRRSGKLRSVHVECWMDRLETEEQTLAAEEQRVFQDISYLRSLT